MRERKSKKGLPPEAYIEMNGEKYAPYISPEENIREFTFRSVALGIVMGIVFGMANAYLGLKVGMTVSASIPVAVISMGILRGLLKRGTILENNMVQTIGSAGESLAAGVIFTVPALFIWGVPPSLGQIFLFALIGGMLGILFMVPLRRFLIVREHGRLPYPEGTACAEVLIAGEEGGAKAKFVFVGVGVGAVYKFLMGGLGLWGETPRVSFTRPRTTLGVDAIPMLLGVGYIIGPRIAAYMLAGGALAWFGFIPLIAFFGSKSGNCVFPATDMLIADMTPDDIWHYYIRYIGAGAVALGGLVSLVKAIPVIYSSFVVAVRELLSKTKGAVETRTQKDLPMIWILSGSVFFALLIAVLPSIKIGVVGAFLTVIFTFFFVTVSARLVGLVGSSSNPASGMTIATLLATAVILHYFGFSGMEGKIAALGAGAIVCIGICVAGDTSQDLKTGYLTGATPWKQQIGELIGVLTSALFIGLSVYLLYNAYGIGVKTPEHPNPLKAPQAVLMALVIEGVMEANLPWELVFIGVAAALVVELVGIPSLPFAVGLYLPLDLSTPIIAGGLIRMVVEKKKVVAERLDSMRERGILYASGLIAGEALVGIVLAVLAWRGVAHYLTSWRPESFTSFIEGPGRLLSLGIFCLLAFSLYYIAVKGKESE